MLGALASGGLSPCTHAKEPASAARYEEDGRKFLRGLLDYGYYDTALDYLDQARNSPLCSAALKQDIDYEAGVALFRWSRTAAPADRDKLLDQSKERFKKFLAEHPAHPKAFSVKLQLADNLRERGRIKIAQSESPKNTSERKKQIRGDARKLFTEAQALIGELEKSATERVLRYQKAKTDPQDSRAAAERDQARIDYLLVRLNAGRVLFELGQTYEPGSAEAKKYFEQAIARFNDLYHKYTEYEVRFEARLWEARVWNELGQQAKALATLDDLLGQENEGPPLRLKILAAAEKLEILFRAKKYAEAIKFYESWESRGAESTNEEENDFGPGPPRRNVRAAEQEASSAEGLALRYAAGEAALEAARGISDNDKGGAKLRRECLALARKTLSFVARHRGADQAAARTKLNDPLLTGNVGEEESLPQNFAEARDRGREALEQLDAPELKEEAAAKLRDRATRCFQLALAMKPPKTAPEDIAQIQSWLAYLYYLDKRYYDAAAIGEFFAERRPGDASAQQLARIALAAYTELFRESPEKSDAEFFAGRMNALADIIARRWPVSTAADDARMLRIRLAVVRGEVEKALAELKGFPTDSPRRGEAELMTGQALWGAYLDACRKPEAERPSPAELASLTTRAEKVLEAGVERMRGNADADEKLELTLAESALLLAQICLDTNRTDKAAAWLTDPKFGPLTLCEANNPLTAGKAVFRRETYKAALRAFVAVHDLDRAEKAMTALEKQSGDTNLTRIYLVLGKELEGLLKRLQEQGNRQQAAAVRRGFELFLTRIVRRPQAELNFNTLSWVAETFKNLGASLDAPDSPPSKEAENYYRKAAETYEKMLRLCAADKSFPPSPAAATAIRLRLSRCLRHLGQYEKAVDLLVEILKSNNSALDVQIEGAYAYQDWGDIRSRCYDLAIYGANPVETKQGKANLIWGWARISRVLQSKPDYKSTFFEARYNLALCRLNLGRTQTGAEQKKTLERAIGDIGVIYKLYPELGGPEWHAKFDDLLKKIQKLAKQRERGLKALD
jgi:tetratricopeptide (TPR) repeat protein